MDLVGAFSKVTGGFKEREGGPTIDQTVIYHNAGGDMGLVQEAKGGFILNKRQLGLLVQRDSKPADFEIKMLGDDKFLVGLKEEK